MTNVMELAARISLDSTQFTNGLNNAKGALSTFGGAVKTGFATVAKLGTAAFTATTAAATAFGKTAIDAGMTFDSAMSQVAATMGTTVDEISNLREFAQQMGATTAFSATEAAQA